MEASTAPCCHTAVSCLTLLPHCLLSRSLTTVSCLGLLQLSPASLALAVSSVPANQRTTSPWFVLPALSSKPSFYIQLVATSNLLPNCLLCCAHLAFCVPLGVPHYSMHCLIGCPISIECLFHLYLYACCKCTSVCPANIPVSLSQLSRL